MAVLDAKLPESLPITPYARFGDLSFIFLTLLAGAVTLLIYWRK
jgi:hypothetical protein